MALSSHDKDIPFPIFLGGEHQVFRGMVPFRIRASLSFVGESTEDYGRKNEAKKDRKLPTPPRDSRGINGGVGKTQL